MTFHIHELHQKTKREILEVWEVAKEHMDDQDKKIEQLEKEKLESIDAWNSQLEKASAKIEQLQQENKEIADFYIRKFIYDYIVPDGELSSTDVDYLKARFVDFKFEQLKEGE